MGMTAEDVTQIMGPRFNYDGRCGNFGKYALVFTNNTLIKACKIGEIYTQFGEYAVVNDCEDCDDMEVKTFLNISLFKSVSLVTSSPCNLECGKNI